MAEKTMQPLVIRTVTKDDATAISALVIRTLQTSNAQHYDAANIARAVSHFAPADVAARLDDPTTVVAVRDADVLGTARLSWAPNMSFVSLRTVFVCSAAQGQGIGRAMYDYLPRAIPLGTQINVRSSLHGEGFYAHLGFRKVRDHWNGSEQTIEMVRTR
jgi:GNAT superfamily N-acetyltransferase